MSARLINLIVCLGLLFFTSLASATDYETDTIVNNAITKFMRVNRIPGVAVELYVDGVPHSYTFGYANKSTAQPITQNSIFEIGSVTKIFTSLLFAMELNEGKMRLNDSITKYFRNYIKPELDLSKLH